jgi:acyl-CoA hydrolase
MMAAGRLAVYADGPDGPLPDPTVLGIGPEDRLLLGWVVRTPDWLGGAAILSRRPELRTFMVGAGLRRAVSDGAVGYIPCRLSALPGLLAGRWRPDLVVVGAVETPQGWRLAGSPGWAGAAVGAAAEVVIERWPAEAAPALGPRLPQCRVRAVVERTDPPDPPPTHRPGPGHAAIGRLVAGLVPEGATIQWGPGAVGAAVVAALDRPVRVRSGLVTDELADLAERGLLAAPAESAYLWGGRRLRSLAESGDLVLRPVDYTHDLTAISATSRFVAVNTALEVGLDGSVNVECVGGRVVTGPGGHPDFAAGAARSPGGLSVVALPSTAGGRSTIVSRAEVVSTPRCDVDVVVTEHGVADLRDCDPQERAARLIAIADPAQRPALAG